MKEVEDFKREIERQAKQYEGKLATLTAINGVLKSENAQLRQQLDEASGPRTDVEEELIEVKEEFTKRLGVSEKKIAALKEERERLRSQLSAAAKGGTTFETRLQEKEEYIQSLRHEGEELSRKNGELEATARKLRANIRDLELERDKIAGKVESLQAELTRTQENALRDTQAARVQVEELEQELQEVRRDSLRQIAEAQKKAVEAVRMAESKAYKGEEKALAILEDKEAEMIRRMQDMRREMELSAAKSSEREESLQREIYRLQDHIREMENSATELQSNASDTTRPLLRQIESMAATHSAQTQAAQERERILHKQLKQCEESTAAANEAERQASARAAASEQALHLMKQEAGAAVREAAAVKALLAVEQSRSVALEANNERLSKELEATSSHLSQVEEELRSLFEKAWEADAQVRSLTHETTALKAALKQASSGGGVPRKDTPTSSSEHGPQADNSHDPAQAASTRAAQKPQPIQTEIEDGQRPSGYSVASLLDVSPLPLTHSSPLTRISSTPNSLVSLLEHQLAIAEAARDRTNEQLLSALEKAEQADTELKKIADDYEAQLVEVRTMLEMSYELLGERNERVEQLEDDIREMKRIFHAELENAVNMMQAAQQELSQSKQQENGI